jgi:exodeoxyribonuclease VII small subunit
MPDEPELGFEEALTQLERIVEHLERGEPALAAALTQYEDGVRLLRHCYLLLDQAEQSVALLTGVDDQGNPQTIPFDATATIARELGPAARTGQSDSAKRDPANSTEIDSAVQSAGLGMPGTSPNPEVEKCAPPV